METLKRSRSASTEECCAWPSADFAAPLARPVPGEQMSQYLGRLRASLTSGTFLSKPSIDEPGIYIAKRRIRAAAGSQVKMLELAGTIFYHVIIYLKEADKLVALDFGPCGAADITANLAEEVPAGPILQDPADAPASGPGELPLLYMRTAPLPLSHSLVQQALEFAQGQAYHAFSNNCIATSDFLVRALTNGAVCGAPLIFDALCGHAAAQDPPLLLMFMLMTGLSWFDVCDGSRLAAAFLKHRAVGGAAAAAPAPAAGPALPAPAAKAAKHEQQRIENNAALPKAAPANNSSRLVAVNGAAVQAEGLAAAQVMQTGPMVGACEGAHESSADAAVQVASEGKCAGRMGGSTSSDSEDTLAGVGALAN